VKQFAYRSVIVFI